MEQLVSFLALASMAAMAFWGLKWMARAAKSQARRDNPLSPTDLRLLEESTARLMADLRATTDECVARLSAACAEARALTDRLVVPGGLSAVRSDHEPVVQAAMRESVPRGEVELLRGLRSIGMLGGPPEDA